MSWHPNDLVTDADLADYEGDILKKFGQSTWLAKRTKALEDWLWPVLKGHGFDPGKLRTRYEPDAVFGYTGAAYGDKLAASRDTTEDDLNLATIFATVGTDALYIGSTAPFRGLSVRMADAVSAVAGVLSVAYWNGNWENVLVADGTSQSSGKPFSGGGAVTWLLPMDWMTRKVNSSSALYWVKVTISATPTSAKASQISVIRASSLRAPAVCRTLQLIFREAPTSSDGPWLEKAEYYEKEGDAALQRALQICGGEFDTDGSEAISTDEADQTSAEVSTFTGGFAFERG